MSTPEEEAAEQKLRRYAKEYLDASGMAKSSETRRKQLREIILGLLTSQGTEDEKGNRWLPAIDHVMKAEKRESVSFNAGKAEAWLRANGWWDEAKVTVPEEIIPAHDTIDEDALHAFIFSHRFDTDVPDELPDVVYNRKETYAIKVTKEEQYEY
jgi:hypothetical protein